MYANIGTHWIALRANGNIMTYFDSFGVEPHPRRNQKKIIDNKNIKKSTIATNIFGI